MPTLLNTQSKTVFANSFIDSLSDSILYMFIGKTTPWSNESSPDTITNTVANLATVLDNIFAIKKLGEANACLVVPRIDWTTSTIYDEYSSSDATLFTKDFYVLSSDMNVYKCIDNADGSASTAQPTGQSTSQIVTADGYIWKFMYNLSSTVQVNFLTTQYLPVPTGSKKTSQQILVENSSVYSSGTPAGGHGHNAAFELGASKLMIIQNFEGSESSIIDATSKYREVGIVSNVNLNSGSAATGSVYSVGDTNSTVNIFSSQVLYVESLAPIQRNEDQTETIKITIDFNQ